MVLLSAHRAGALESGLNEGSLESLNNAVESDVEFVEFDVQRFADGVYFLAHDESITIDGIAYSASDISSKEASDRGYEYVTLVECLRGLRSKKKAHVDLKFESPHHLPLERSWEVEAAKIILSEMDSDEIILTTLEDESVRRLRAFFSEDYPGLLIGLSLGRNMEGKGILETFRVRLSEIFPARRIANCGANLIVCERRLARLAVAKWSAKHGYPLLVWTVDDPNELADWLARENTWLVTTNYPKLAARLREGTSPRSGQC